MRLGDNDPFWDQHSGGSGHTAYPEWSPADGALAAELYASTHDKTRLFLDLLIDRPGELVESTWIAEQMIGSANGADKRAGPRVVARSIWNMRQAQMASGRRYPFKWWRGQKRMPTRYAMKPTVAALFRQAWLANPAELDSPTAPTAPTAPTG